MQAPDFAPCVSETVLDRPSSLTFGLSLDPTETLVVSANVCFVFEY